ncbi:unnamed protein product [Toxocara canis]|uniref:F-box domain-containing protein n=1 Tax=Toxocara canis TaxID=6265 RepID=A0A183V5A9_TOXCA|nr:unnamed protein product [Toxocara canis]
MSVNDSMECSSASHSRWETNNGPQNDVLLDSTLLADVVRMTTAISPIVKVAELNGICSDWHYWCLRAFRYCNDLRLEVPCGNAAALRVQGSLMLSSDQAVQCVEYLLSRIECLKQLYICLRGPSVDILNDVLDALIDSDKVQLESISVSGRRGGLRVERLSKLITKCASTLRVAGKVGILEFEEALRRDAKLDLERLSLNNYDLFDESSGMNRMGAEMAAAFSRITSAPTALRVRHLSLSAVGGFNAAIQPYNDFIKRAKVQSLRVTQQTGGLFDGSGLLPSSPLYDVTSFEVDQFPNRCHVPSEIRVVFPSLKRLLINSSLIPLRDLEHAFAYAAEWLATFAAIELVGVLTAEVKHDYGDAQKADKIRCHIEDLERCGARIRIQSSENFSYPTHFIISNGAGTFRFMICCLCDIWLLADIIDIV